MEKKERYSYDYFIDGAVFIDAENDHDMDMDTVCSLLNKQDKHIKELELLLKADKKIETNSLNGFEKLRQENQQLKQSQKQLAIEELEKVKADINTYNKEHCFLFPEIDTCNKSVEIIDNQIKVLKGEE